MFSGDDRSALLDLFLDHACIFTPPRDFASKYHRAERLRARHPELATASLPCAVVCGELDHVRDLLSKRPEEVHDKGGARGWEPLLYACYGRLPHDKARDNGLAMVQLLLDAGADPNAHFISPDEWRLRFTALTGAMGQGEMGQPQHPQAEAVARLLLDAGAHPNDGQGLYNTHLEGDDPRWLELLFAYGLGPADPVNWSAEPREEDRDRKVLDYLVVQAAYNGHDQRLRALLKRGANPSSASIYDGKSAYHHALMGGHDKCAQLLKEHGAEPLALSGHDAFIAAVASGDEETARQLLAQDPSLIDDVEPLTRMASSGDLEGVRLLLELGVDPNKEGQHGHRALHNASGQREMAELLLAHGADPRGRAFGGRPTGWALHGGHLEMARFLAEQSRSLLDAVQASHVELVTRLLELEPSCIVERSPGGGNALHFLPAKAEDAEALIGLLLKAGLDPEEQNSEGRNAVQALNEAGFDQVADLLQAAVEAQR